jgi:hypothetical protein
VIARARTVLDALEAGTARAEGAESKTLIDDLPLFSAAPRTTAASAV